MIIATFIWGIMMGFSTQSCTYRAICAFLYPASDFPSRSRYSRICGNLNNVLKIIRYEYVKSLDNQATYAVIDSFPCPLCATTETDVQNFSLKSQILATMRRKSYITMDLKSA